MGKRKKNLLMSCRQLSKKSTIKNVVWCQHKKCIESTRCFKTNTDLGKHIVEQHGYSTIDNPQIHTVVDQFENEQFEYKINMNSSGKEKICQTIVAMANCLGGRIYFGINDGRIVYGVHNSSNWDKYMLEIAGSLKYHAEPEIPLIKAHHKLLNKYHNLLWIEVQSLPEKEYKYKGKKYVRCLSSNQLVQTDYTYDSLLADIARNTKKIKQQDKYITKLESELALKDEYIENILKNFLPSKK